MITAERKKTKSRFESVETTDPRSEADRINSNSKFDSAEEATDELLAAVKGMNAEQQEFVLRYGCNRLIHDSRHAARGNPNISNAEDNGKPQRAAGANSTTTMPRSGRAAQLAVSRGYLNNYFVGDKRLGDCTKEDLEDQIARHKGAINGFRNESLFLTRIVKKLPNKTSTVRKVLNESKVLALRPPNQ